MGIYDRPYYGPESEGHSFRPTSDQSMVNKIILVNVIAYVANIVLSGSLTDLMKLESPEVFTNLLLLWKLLTYGFAHAEINSSSFIFHILMNMYMLWMFGRDIESIYGPKEFLAIYLTMIVVSGFVWALIQFLSGSRGVVIGASGGVAGIFILSVLHFPHRKLMLMFIPIPIPAWFLGGLIVFMDAMGAVTGRSLMGSNVAFTCHLAGAASALIYFRAGLRISSWLPTNFSLKKTGLRSRKHLRLHDPEDRMAEMDAKADKVLEKLHASGEASLTPKERKILEDYSRRVRQKRS